MARGHSPMPVDSLAFQPPPPPKQAGPGMPPPVQNGIMQPQMQPPVHAQQQQQNHHHHHHHHHQIQLPQYPPHHHQYHHHLHHHHQPAKREPRRKTQAQAQALAQTQAQAQQVADRMAGITNSFNANLRHHYDAQANAIQVDMNLILQSNPYDGPLPDDEETIVKQIYDSFLKGKSPADPSAEADFVSTVGKWYQQYVREVNKKIEERDVGLAMLARKFESQQAEHDQLYQFRVRMAEEEYRILSNTVRERLVQQLTQKQTRLMKEKDMLDLNDSNSHLLHPNQFSIAHPSSPGGTQNPRKTRHARHRVLEQDEIPAPAELKRKRKAGSMADLDEDSPNQSMINSSGYRHSPFRDAQVRMAHAQYKSSAYSIDKLFTEKELNMNTNHAAIAATDYLVKLKKRITEDSSSSSDEAKADDDEDGSAHRHLLADSDRNGINGTRNSLRSSMLDLSSSSKQPPFAIPKYIPISSGAKANGAPIYPSTLNQTEIEQDLLIMSRAGDTYDDPILNRLLDAACAPAQVAEYHFRSQYEGGGLSGRQSSTEPGSRGSPMPSSVTYMNSASDLLYPTPGAYGSVNESPDALAAATAGILASLSASREGLLASVAGSLATSRQPSAAAESGRGGGSNNGDGGLAMKRTVSSTGRRARS